ncbi:MAG: DNA adenine methylase [Spirochaetales bacterium]|nr:DNA adenine methylase [Spirochaetales bacterium]
MSGDQFKREQETFGPAGENEAFLTRQLVTCIGNKRGLLDFIGRGVERAAKRLGKSRLDCADLFSGSGVVARFLKRYARSLVANDVERYAEIGNTCYLANGSEIDLPRLREEYKALKARLDAGPLEAGFIAELYAPADDARIEPGERAFYTARNARYLDTARRLIGELPEGDRPFFIAPLLSEASVHANTAGVFKGFYKNSRTGRGQFGGNNRDALVRILGDVELPFPIWSSFECEVRVSRDDANALARRLPEIDFAYLDPPYNQHPYGSNYFMLNLIADYERPVRLSRVSGIPPDWNRSRYNKAPLVLDAFRDLVENLPAKMLLVSFNSEGFINRREMLALLGRIGRVEVLETKYNAFRGSRNLGGRSIHVKEYLYLMEKK